MSDNERTESESAGVFGKEDVEQAMQEADEWAAQQCSVELDTTELEDEYFQAYLQHYNITATPCPTPSNNMMGVRYVGKRLDLMAMIHDQFSDGSGDSDELLNEFIEPLP